MEVTFDINKDEVYTEVAQTSSYTGAKMDDDANAYERIFTTDEDKSQLDRFWNESCVTFCEVMKRYLVSDTPITQTSAVTPMSEPFHPSIPDIPSVIIPIHPFGEVTGHRFNMELSKSFDTALLPSMRQELFSYFVMNITAKWYGFTNKKEATEYADAAASLLEGVHRKACFKRKPQRPTY